MAPGNIDLPFERGVSLTKFGARAERKGKGATKASHFPNRL